MHSPVPQCVGQLTRKVKLGRTITLIHQVQSKDLTHFRSGRVWARVKMPMINKLMPTPLDPELLVPRPANQLGFLNQINSVITLPNPRLMSTTYSGC